MKNNKSSLVVGASTNPARYSNQAMHLLKEKNFPVYAYALRENQMDEIKIENDWSKFKDKNIHTVTLYVGPQNQNDLIDPILALKPQRIIFNPGAENPEFEKKALDANIEILRACTLVMLRTGQY